MASLGTKESVDKSAKTVDIPLPETYDEAWDIIKRYESADAVDEAISDSVTHHCDNSGVSLLDEHWAGDEASERNAYVTEETYIHSK